MSRKFIVIILCVSLLANIATAGAFYQYSKRKKTAAPEVINQAISERRAEFPNLGIRAHLDFYDYIINFTKLRTQIDSYVQESGKEIGIYFEYLPTGVSVSNNAQMEVQLASLGKVPVTMAIYKQIESGKINSQTVITLQESDLNNKFGSLWKKGAGYQLTLDEAVRLTLQESDNTAVIALSRLLPNDALDVVFYQFDLPKKVEEGLPVLSPKAYSSILRSLYLSTYLSKENSNKILEYMKLSSFNDQLVAGVPADVPVAHKVGVYEKPGSTNDIYSDCGIVYMPNRPYMLCIMMHNSKDSADATISKISSIVYQYIKSIN